MTLPILVTMPSAFRASMELLIAGVGFKMYGDPNYKVYSHEGNFIGKLPYYMVATLIAYNNRNTGWGYVNIRSPRDNYEHTITYGYRKFSEEEFDEVQRMMDFYFENPVTIH